MYIQQNIHILHYFQHVTQFLEQKNKKLLLKDVTRRTTQGAKVTNKKKRDATEYVNEIIRK